MTGIRVKKAWLPWIVVGVVLVIDQVLKVLIKTNMTLGETIPVIGDIFFLHFTENFGMAFGMEIPGEFGKLKLSLLRIGALCLIGWYIMKMIKAGAPRGFLISLGLVFGGAAGNIIDSSIYSLIFSQSTFTQVAQLFPEGGGYGTFLHGYVVDMFYAPVIRGYYPEWFPFWAGREFIFFRPVFNIADAAITSGVFTMLIFQKKYFNFEASKKSASPREEEAISTAENS